ncbi:indole-3-glycerol phosphate synthase TrpC [Flavobacterium sp. IMCC34852]|uniref:Indole-3-glycerol phosphate synthase n=1 Tax=Flavobacterium rivulicola TaxID=2732161 RepID=A0A7Y3R9D2_9FLAO|nr:indole-3-glycerol phosphate synthase TrpC [Flavobacterium sp. IMCC34852]NNT72297.1 indole-3-glycerol phosphate synthase TrpC [Flavobacterium sp. IMCC34852]
MNILNQIIASKKQEVALKKSIITINQLENSDLFNTKTHSLSKSIINSPFGIIAEHKRRSPSKATINHSLAVEEVVKGYENAGASGISVLTDSQYFGGSLDDLLLAKASLNTPLLRKEFIIDEYQILEAKANGADAILLIAAVLTRAEIKTLSEFAHSIALEVLLEVHNLEELEKSIMPSLDIIGMNNRNLKTFEVSLQNSIDLVTQIPNDFVKISESGLSKPEDVKLLKSQGFQGFLIGENFMKTDNPGAALEQFINQLKV